MLPVGQLYMNFELCTRPSQGTSRQGQSGHEIVTCNFLVTLGGVVLRSTFRSTFRYTFCKEKKKETKIMHSLAPALTLTLTQTFSLNHLANKQLQGPATHSTASSTVARWIYEQLLVNIETLT